MYAENGSKNRSGGFNQLLLENKTVPVFVCSEAGVRCHVHLLDLYLCKTPPMAFKKDWFYMKPLGDHVTTDPVKPWYGSQPCGENKLATMVKSMFSQVGISGKTNHSLRATGASNLFQAGIPVQERTSHHSLKALCMYECTTTSQHIAVLSVLSGAGDTSSPSTSAQKMQIPAVPSAMFASVSNCVINVNILLLPNNAELYL